MFIVLVDRHYWYVMRYDRTYIVVLIGWMDISERINNEKEKQTKTACVYCVCGGCCAGYQQIRNKKKKTRKEKKTRKSKEKV